MRLFRSILLPVPFLLLLPLHLASAADPTLPALTDTRGANAPAESTTAQATKTSASKPTKTSPTAAASSDARAVPALSSSTDLGGLVTDVPKLEGDDYPAPSVPPTANAPFMQKSSLPEGTIFICVGAALAFIALVILAWRGIVAWSLHRSVRRSAMAQNSKYTYIGDTKSSTRGPHSHLGSKLASPFAGSTLTLDQFPPSSAGGKGGKPTLSAPGSRNSLFFSPTASHAAGNLSPSSNRASTYLPAGYYASNAPSSNTQSETQPQPGISMSNLAPGTAANNRHSRRSRSIEPSPSPSSRGERPSTGGGLGSTLNLSTTALAGGQGGGSEGRAPSAYLEDLFERGVDVVTAEEQAAAQATEKRTDGVVERDVEGKKDKEKEAGRNRDDTGERERGERRRSGHHSGGGERRRSAHLHRSERRRSHTAAGAGGEDSSKREHAHTHAHTHTHGHRRERRRSSTHGLETNNNNAPPSSRRRESRTMVEMDTSSRSPQQQQYERSSRVEREERRRVRRPVSGF